MTEGVHSAKRSTADRVGDGPTERAEGWAGPRWLWFGALGGPVGWLLHLYLAWGVVETSCTAGVATFIGIDLKALVPLLIVVPGVIALAAGVVAVRAAVVLHRAENEPPAGVAPRRIARAGFMARVGAVLAGLSLMMIIFGGAAVVLFTPCER
jgi:hypothetical protein